MSITTFCRRTKWKRQTAVGLELLAEQGNYHAVQRILHSNPYFWSPYVSGYTSNLISGCPNSDNVPMFQKMSLSFPPLSVISQAPTNSMPPISHHTARNVEQCAVGKT